MDYDEVIDVRGLAYRLCAEFGRADDAATMDALRGPMNLAYRTASEAVLERPGQCRTRSGTWTVSQLGLRRQAVRCQSLPEGNGIGRSRRPGDAVSDRRGAEGRCDGILVRELWARAVMSRGRRVLG